MQTRTRERLEQDEKATLAPCAQLSAESRGRKHREPQHPYRTCYQRDRSRIIHSRAFRRLEYKTQVFLSGSGDHLRTRLTHTIEVASICRVIARALGLNEDLAEAIALAHDLGHSPFGHSGEETLDRLMKDHGGFEHNEQSLRVVEYLETKYPRFRGLNLSVELLEGLQKRPPMEPGEESVQPQGLSLEAQIADLADEIAYYSHDLDDGLEFNLLTPEQLAELEIWRETESSAVTDFSDLSGRALHNYAIRCLIDHEVEDVVHTSAGLIAESGVASADEARSSPVPLIAHSPDVDRRNRQMREFLYANLYYHPTVAEANQRSCRMLETVFTAYLEHPTMIGETTARLIETEGLYRVVCDYVSGMTDPYLLHEYEQLQKRKPCRT